MEIRLGNSSDIPSVAALLGETFAGDPVMREYIDPAGENAETGEVQEILTEYFTVELESLYLPCGRVDIAEEDGEFLGVALWLPPEADQGTLLRLQQFSRLAGLLGSNLPRALRLNRYWAEATPKFPHWYLYTLATTAEARGKGVGTTLLGHGLAQTEGLPVYLEATSERAAKLYGRFGFVKLGIIPTPLEAKEIAMWHPAAA